MSVPAQFSHQVTRLQFPKDVHFGDDISIWIAKAGDIALGNMYLHVQWPQTCPVSDSAGTRMIEFVELRYENNLLERHYGESIELLNDIQVPAGKQQVLTGLLGKGLTSNLSDYYIRMPFKIHLPLCALDKPPVFRVKFRSSREFALINWTRPIQVGLLVDYVYITKAERDYFKTNTFDYLTHTVQRIEFSVGAGVTTTTFLTEFTRPVKELYWVIQTDGAGGYDFTNQGTDHLSTLQLQLNGVDIIKPTELGFPLYLRTIQGLENHTRVPNRQFYMYSFALDPEHPDQPTGSVNFSALSRQQHTLQLTPCSFSRQVRVYAISHSVVRVSQGTAQPLFDTVQEGGSETLNTPKKYTPNIPVINFTFTTLGSTGAFGPSSNTYTQSPPGSWSVTNGIQNWTVPVSGTYQITAAGATSTNNGRVVMGSVNLAQGQVIQMIIGQLPEPYPNAIPDDNITVGGGGGTFIVSNGVPLIVASGGDGDGGNPGQFKPFGNGNGVNGAGYLTNGASTDPFFPIVQPIAYVHGGYGSVYQYGQNNIREEGGFGGAAGPVGRVTTVINITADGQIATCTTDVPHGYPAQYIVQISGSNFFDGQQQIQVTGLTTFVFATTIISIIDSGKVQPALTFAYSGGGGYSGATCYADSSVAKFTDLGATSISSGYANFQLRDFIL